MGFVARRQSTKIGGQIDYLIVRLIILTLCNAETGENCVMRSFVVCTFRQILRVIRSMRIRWAGKVARMGEKGNAYMILLGTPEECDHLEDIGVDG
jgi:hypothetical protein